jgi:nucleotide-binding universal stress UspA family protein
LGDYAKTYIFEKITNPTSSNFMKDLSQTLTILVPHDFTEVADNALLHANKLSKVLNRPVTLTHIVKTDKDKKGATDKLDAIASKNAASNGVETQTLVIAGDYLEKIGEVAEIVKATLVVMGTHGVRGIQKLIGSYALKVITNSNVPYLVVQAPPTGQEGYQNIVLPMDFSKESKQKLDWAVYIAELFGSKFHLLSDYESDEFTAKALKNNISYAKSYLTNNNLTFDLHELGKHTQGLTRETITLSKNVHADLIVVMTTMDKGISEYVMGAPEQAIIANDAQIPVMCINPVDIMRSKDGLTIANFA